MDFASPSQAGRITALLLCLCLSSRALPQEPRADADRKATVRRLYAEKRWEEIVQFAPLSSDPAELDLNRGLARSEEHTSELQSRLHLVCRLLLEKKKKQQSTLD